MAENSRAISEPVLISFGQQGESFDAGHRLADGVPVGLRLTQNRARFPAFLAGSLALHLAVLAALIWTEHAPRFKPDVQQEIPVELVTDPAKDASSATKGKAKPSGGPAEFKPGTAGKPVAPKPAEAKKPVAPPKPEAPKPEAAKPAAPKPAAPPPKPPEPAPAKPPRPNLLLPSLSRRLPSRRSLSRRRVPRRKSNRHRRHNQLRRSRHSHLCSLLNRRPHQ